MLAQSGLTEGWCNDSKECCCYLRNKQLVKHGPIFTIWS